MEEVGKLERLVHRPDVILGDPEELVSLSWEQEINLDCGPGDDFGESFAD